MASTSSLASTPSPIPTKATTNLRISRYSNSNLSFRLSPKPNLIRFFTQGSVPNQVFCPRVKAQLNEVNQLQNLFPQSFFESMFSNICSFLDMLLGSSFLLKAGLDGSSNAAAPSITKSESKVETLGTKDPKPSTELSSGVLATEESISQFISQVASLVLVDSRDIVELHLKQLDIEVTIRKKEAIPHLQSPPQPAIVYSPPSVVSPPVAPSSTSTHTPAPPARAPSSSSPPAVKSSKSSHPPLKSPMAGTFYKCPAPGEPAFVKVGDKVKKGQVLCIIEAMKLMNEIEADQSGTIVDILAEDGKPVSVDTPLFVIEP
uniref:Biotin carboxyl carrier protein of acetyl-CoA carboxylase n=1 Tax=Lupinus angustifolius TaxID=3871 RepID=A0A451EHC7_LUPAN|nr:biotin carboxyl carrier protein of acetyl-CoA carboxylase-like protein [Lupinus angustifolius]